MNWQMAGGVNWQKAGGVNWHSSHLNNGSSEDTTVVVTKHVTCTCKVTRAASIDMLHEVFVINTFFIYTLEFHFLFLHT